MQITQLGANSFTGTATQAISHLQGLTGSENVLIVSKNDFPSTTLPNISTQTLTTLEDWIAAITYRLIDITASTQNSERLVSASENNPSLDNGFYVTGQNFVVRSIAVEFYSTNPLATRPSPTDI